MNNVFENHLDVAYDYDEGRWWSRSNCTNRCIFWYFQCFWLGTRITFHQRGCPKNWSAEDGSILFRNFRSHATLRVGKSFFRCARSLPSNWFMPLDGRQDWATDDGQGCNECNRTGIAQKEKTPVKLRANKNLCIFIDMQSAVAGRRWRREERTCVCASVSAALPWHLEGVGCLVLQKGGWSCVGRHVWRIVELHNMHFFIGHPPKIYSPTHIDLLPDNCPESSNTTTMGMPSSMPIVLRICVHVRVPALVVFWHCAELWVVYAVGDRLNVIFHCNSRGFFQGGFHQRISIKFWETSLVRRAGIAICAYPSNESNSCEK